MKWYIGNEGWPYSCLVSKAYMEILISEIDNLEVSSPKIDNTLDDVHDESVLPESALPSKEASNEQSNVTMRDFGDHSYSRTSQPAPPASFIHPSSEESPKYGPAPLPAVSIHTRSLQNW
ncbi:hypothetical protein LINGRAHAP2_LOCUS7769 [Linum grandiflorum]